MSKAPSDATKLRELKRQYAALSVQYLTASRERDQYRARATKAEQEAAEWRSRFDVLLRRGQQK